MPLLDGQSNDIINENRKQLKRDGFSEKQAIAIAMKRAGKSKKLSSVAAKVAKRPAQNKLQIKKTY